jgi:hypothetical protein
MFMAVTFELPLPFVNIVENTHNYNLSPLKTQDHEND